MCFPPSAEKLPSLLFITLIALFTIPSTFAQRSNPDHREIYQSIYKLEADLVKYLDAKAEL